VPTLSTNDEFVKCTLPGVPGATVYPKPESSYGSSSCSAPSNWQLREQPTSNTLPLRKPRADQAEVTNCPLLYRTKPSLTQIIFSRSRQFCTPFRPCSPPRRQARITMRGCLSSNDPPQVLLRNLTVTQLAKHHVLLRKMMPNTPNERPSSSLVFGPCSPKINPFLTIRFASFSSLMAVSSTKNLRCVRSRMPAS
jgi:hypothetical protein